MERSNRNTVLMTLCCGLLAANLFVSLRGTPVAAQGGTLREDAKQYKVMPTNLGSDLEDRLNAMASRGWHMRQILASNGTPTTWVVYEKDKETAGRPGTESP